MKIIAYPYELDYFACEIIDPHTLIKSVSEPYTSEPIIIEQFTMEHLDELPEDCDAEFLIDEIECLVRLNDGSVLFSTETFWEVARNVLLWAKDNPDDESDDSDQEEYYTKPSTDISALSANQYAEVVSLIDARIKVKSLYGKN